MKDINVFQKRFIQNTHRHPNFSWDDFVVLMTAELWEKMFYMEESGGEPDVIIDQQRILVVDMSQESPSGRRNCCYDQAARIKRKKFPPETSAWEDALKHGIYLVDEDLYLRINKIEALDLKTSSWLDTPASIRSKGGALTGDTRFGRTFIYHNGADSYYGVRAYRGYFVVSK